MSSFSSVESVEGARLLDCYQGQPGHGRMIDILLSKTSRSGYRRSRLIPPIGDLQKYRGGRKEHL